MESRLPPEGTNLFRKINSQTALAEAKGIKVIKLSIGIPALLPFLSAREVAAKEVMNPDLKIHTYQDDGCYIPNYAERFIKALFPDHCFEDNLFYLPTPGNKSMLGIAISCCRLRSDEFVATMTDPGYPTPAIQADYLNVSHYALPTNPENSFLFPIDEDTIIPGTRLIMLNLPHNPSGQIASSDWLHRLCRFCEIHKIRLLNDDPYQLFSHSDKSSVLCKIAPLYPGLAWVHLCSSSKIANTPGWRVGAMVGSRTFIEDITKVKGNSDSGFAGPLAAGILHALEHDYERIIEMQKMYFDRIQILVDILLNSGMRLAVRPMAGFFTLWLVPKRAFGQDIISAEHFNTLMLENTGIVGVYFEPSYIRYAVTIDIESVADAIRRGFAEANVSY